MRSRQGFRPLDSVEQLIMKHRLAVEDMELNHYVCWILDLPGCFSSAKTKEVALILAPSRISSYFNWIQSHDASAQTPEASSAVELVEEFAAFASEEDPEYLVNAFFEDDRRPLTEEDVTSSLQLLEWARRDLLNLIEPFTPNQLAQPLEGELRGTLLGILEHVCGAENWYFSQFGLDLDWCQLSEDIYGKLAAVRANTRSQLLPLIGDERVFKNVGERWSARKILRRTLWHERAHTEQIIRLILH